jgi:geranylgeranyl reductase family protein
MALAQKGHDVLLLDRQKFPRDKICGDGVPVSAIKVLNQLGMADKIAQADFYRIDSLLIVSPRGYELESPLDLHDDGANSYVVPRLKFDYLLYQHALDSGAEFCQAQVIAPLLERGRVVGVRVRCQNTIQDIRARLVIAADGVTSVVARALRPDKQQDMHRAVAIRAYVDDFAIQAHQVEFYLYKSILPGYAWIFPTAEGQANIGLGIRLDRFRHMKGNLEKMLDQFLSLPDIKKRFKPTTRMYGVASWQLNFGSQPIQRAYEGAMLVGDAANLINPLTGGGICNAIVSAQIAAAVAHEALQADDVSRERLKQYETLCDQELWPGMKRSFFMQQRLVPYPLLLEGLIRTLGTNSSFAQTFLNKF